MEQSANTNLIREGPPAEFVTGGRPHLLGTKKVNIHGILSVRGSHDARLDQRWSTRKDRLPTDSVSSGFGLVFRGRLSVPPC